MQEAYLKDVEVSLRYANGVVDTIKLIGEHTKKQIIEHLIDNYRAVEFQFKDNSGKTVIVKPREVQ